jgi:hypothetical protein
LRRKTAKLAHQLPSVTKEHSLVKAKIFKGHAHNDDYRVPSAYKNGGFALEDLVVINKYRSALKNLIS